MKSKLFVFTQFALIILIALRTGVLGNAYSNIIFLMAVILGLWSIFSMDFNFSIFPDIPDKLSNFNRSGPYKYVRHPMYTSVLLATVAWVVGSFDVISLLMWLVLTSVLILKSKYEEKQLKERFEDYKNYIKRTSAIFPFIY